MHLSYGWHFYQFLYPSVTNPYHVETDERRIVCWKYCIPISVTYVRPVKTSFGLEVYYLEMNITATISAVYAGGEKLDIQQECIQNCTCSSGACGVVQAQMPLVSSINKWKFVILIRFCSTTVDWHYAFVDIDLLTASHVERWTRCDLTEVCKMCVINLWSVM